MIFDRALLFMARIFNEIFYFRKFRGASQSLFRVKSVVRKLSTVITAYSGYYAIVKIQNLSR